ncbi:MAG: prepilin-type N-terminal cleavage/methylation domain-containing protein [Gemmatimonadaceae bacterium]|nr:prepilin-type N-terminal cleavage/methylation domain-containing protein [Gemmatimonadaceae bacterium]
MATHAPGRRDRRGMTLVEIIVSLTLFALVLAIGAMTSQRLLTVQAATAVRSARTSATLDALETLRRHVAGAQVARGDLRVARDTALELLHTIGVVTVCRIRHDTLTIATAHDSLPWAGSLPRAVTPDDRVRIWRDGAGEWTDARILTVAAAAGACGDSAAHTTDRASQRLVLDHAPASVRPGALIRVLQRERWSLLRSGDGSWSLALAIWDAARNRFSVPQPLVAPLAAAGARGGAGFEVRAIDAAGAAITDTLYARTAAVVAVLRTARHARLGTFTDSVRIHVATP